MDPIDPKRLRPVVPSKHGRRATSGTASAEGWPQAITSNSILLAFVFAFCSGAAMAQTAPTRFVRIAELQIDLAQLEAFATATREVGRASVTLEEGCVALYAIADTDNRAFVRVFEVYRDAAAYQSHVQTAHFKTFRDTTEAMVTARRLMDATPLSLSRPSQGRRREGRAGTGTRSRCRPFLDHFRVSSAC